jgi:bleomycin hydrolase
MLEEIHRILCIHLGEPPDHFQWQWRDKDKAFHRDGEITPRAFYEKYISHDLDPMVCLIHCPQESKRMNEVYTIDYLGNVVGGREIRYLNVELPVMKAAAIATLKDETPVWFGCDVGKHLDRELGVMDLEIQDYEGLYGVPFELSKAERLDYGASQMTHAMVFTGVDLDDAGNPVKWRVENSWGDKDGDKGFFVMTDPWFDEYNYEVVVEKRYLPAELQELLTKEPVRLPPWDPMGALAVRPHLARQIEGRS